MTPRIPKARTTMAIMTSIRLNPACRCGLIADAPKIPCPQSELRHTTDQADRKLPALLLAIFERDGGGRRRTAAWMEHDAGAAGEVLDRDALSVEIVFTDRPARRLGRFDPHRHRARFEHHTNVFPP